MTTTAVNQKIRVREGTEGTILVVGAWCPGCRAESSANDRGECLFCSRVIVDEDKLSSKELRTMLDLQALGFEGMAAGVHIVVPEEPHEPARKLLATLGATYEVLNGVHPPHLTAVEEAPTYPGQFDASGFATSDEGEKPEPTELVEGEGPAEGTTADHVVDTRWPPVFARPRLAPAASSSSTSPRKRGGATDGLDEGGGGRGDPDARERACFEDDVRQAVRQLVRRDRRGWLPAPDERRPAQRFVRQSCARRCV